MFFERNLSHDDKREFIERIMPLLGDPLNDPFASMILDTYNESQYSGEDKPTAIVLMIAFAGSIVGGVKSDHRAAGTQMVLDIYKHDGRTLDMLINAGKYPATIDELEDMNPMTAYLNKSEALDALYGTLNGMKELNQRHNAKHN